MTFNFNYPNPRPSERGWGSGYPNCQEEAWVPLVAKNGVGFGRIHRGVQDLLELILNECIDRGYPPKAGQCWGSVCRCSHRSDGTCAKDSNGKDVPSNHSWGLAIDFNSIDNPFGGSSFKMPPWVPILFREYGFRWLGPPIDDWQHFDFAGEPSDAVAMTAKARQELGDDDMVGTADQMQGAEDFRAGKQLNETWTPARKFGYNNERRLQAAMESPKPVPGPAGPAGAAGAAGAPGAQGPKGDAGTPELHDHNDRYATVKHPHIVTE